MELFIAGNYGKENGATPTDPKNIYNRAKVIPYLDREETIEVGGIKLEPFTSLNILESYYYLRGNDSFARLIKGFQNFLLDSGAFTFLSNAKTKVDWERYIEEYAEYITNNNIKLFFELDIDSIVGLKQVEKYRERLEKLTNRQCIPVWHPSRGYDYFIKMCKDYPYVALGDEFPPLGIALIMKGRHLCKEMRGARKQGEMTSSYLTGLFKADSALRNEFLSIAR